MGANGSQGMIVCLATEPTAQTPGVARVDQVLLILGTGMGFHNVVISFRSIRKLRGRIRYTPAELVRNIVPIVHRERSDSFLSRHVSRNY